VSKHTMLIAVIIVLAIVAYLYISQKPVPSGLNVNSTAPSDVFAGAAT
jgi:hypothetical protein